MRASLALADTFLVTLAAERLIFAGLANEHPLLALHDAMADISQGTTLHTNGMHLLHIVGYGT